MLFLMINSCSFGQLKSKSTIVWEYKECGKENSAKVNCSSNGLDFYVPIFSQPIPKNVIDSLCNQFLKDSIRSSPSKHISIENFGRYYYSDSSISLALTDYYPLDFNKEYYCIGLIISEKKYNLASHSYYEMIYLPNLGIVYAIHTSYIDPSETKVARVIIHPRYRKHEMLELYDKVFRFLMAECF